MAWDWQVFCRNTTEATLEPSCWAGRGDQTYLQWMLNAWGWTLAVAIAAWFVSVIVGALVGTARTLPNSPWLVRLANAWVELFRNIRHVPGFLLVVFALGFFTSARIAEQVRAGVQALPRGQRNAGMAMGFTTAQTYRYVILPMAFRIILPPLTSESMNLLKNSSVAFAVSIAELTMFAMQAQEETSRGIKYYLGVTALYALSAFAVNRVMAFVEKKVQIPGFVVAGSTGGGH